MSNDRYVEHVQGLRRSNAAQPIPGKKASRPPRKPKHPKKEQED